MIIDMARYFEVARAIEEECMTSITISDPWLGQRELPPGALALIKDQHRLLCYFRDDGRVAGQDLLDDIAAYEAILDAADPDARAREYMEAHELLSLRDGIRRRPREVARSLGWTR